MSNFFKWKINVLPDSILGCFFYLTLRLGRLHLQPVNDSFNLSVSLFLELFSHLFLSLAQPHLLLLGVVIFPSFYLNLCPFFQQFRFIAVPTNNRLRENTKKLHVFFNRQEKLIFTVIYHKTKLFLLHSK